MNQTDEEIGWDRGWDEHKTRQLRRMAELPFSQKLEWLEDAEELGKKLISARENQVVKTPSNR